MCSSDLVKISDGIFLFKMKCLKKYGQKVKFDLIGLENEKSFRRPLIFKMQEHNLLFGKGNAVREKMNKYRYFALVTASALALGGCDKISSFFGGDSKSEEFVQRIEPSKDNGSVGMLLSDFAQLVQNEGQAVVNIQASPARRSVGNGQSEEQGMDLSQFPDNDPFYEFFKRLVPNMPDMPEDQSADEDLNFGSGFIISKDGYILTNTHVVAGMGNIKVLLNDKREYTAKLIGSDTQSDVALLKIDASEELPVVKIGNPKDLKPGEWVAAIGAPFGFDNSVTSGIVSAKGRSLPNESYTPFIQTDVAINPGNSGGPLFNLRMTAAVIVGWAGGSDCGPVGPAGSPPSGGRSGWPAWEQVVLLSEACRMASRARAAAGTRPARAVCAAPPGCCVPDFPPLPPGAPA